MDAEEFRQNRIEGRKQSLKKIIDTFKPYHPIAIHLFGSGAKGFKDELSDIDIWITFHDRDIENILSQQKGIFKSIAPILVRHYSKSWSPIGGAANSIIHDSNYGLFIVDYYISKLSETVIKKDAVIIFGDDSLPRGEWRLKKDVDKDVHDSHKLTDDINLLLSLIFIGAKGIVRNWEGDDFVKTLRIFHMNFRKRHNKKIKRRRISLSFKTLYRLLNDLYSLANPAQRKAIAKIEIYLNEVEAFCVY